MEAASLENIDEIITTEYAFSSVKSVKEVSMHGISLLEIEYDNYGIPSKACVRIESIKRIEYK